MCNFRATSELLIPCHNCSTIRARIAMACADFGRARNHAQFLAIRIGDFQRFLGTPSTHTQVCSLDPDLCNVFLAQDTSPTFHNW